MKGIRSLFNDSLLYAVSNLLQRGLTFLLLPLYAAYFTKSEFGAMEQIYQTVIVLTLVTSLGLPQGLVRGFYLDTQTEEDRNKMLGALITFLAPLTLCVGLIIGWRYESIARLLFRDEGEPLWIKLSVPFYFSLVLQQLPLQIFKTLRQVRQYTLWSLASFALVAAGNVYLIVALHWGLTGMILANIFGFGGVGLFLSIRLLRRIPWNWEWRRLSPLFAFGLPMLPALLARKVLDASDRFMIPYYHGLDELGIYVMGAKIANILDVLLLTPFLYAWQPFFYSLSRDAEAPKVFARVTHYLFLALCFVLLLLAASGSWMLSFLGGGKFAAAQSVIIPLVLSILFNGVQYCVSAGIHLRKKLHQEVLIMIAAAGLNVLLNWFLIPPYRGMGAAISTAASYFFYLVGTFLLSQRFYPVAYPWARMGNASIQTLIAFLLLTQAKTLLFKFGILVFYLFTCPGFDLWRHGELKQIAASSSLFSKEAGASKL